MTPEQKQELLDRMDKLIIRAVSFYLSECEEYESDSPFKYKVPLDEVSRIKLLKEQIKSL